MNLTFAVAGAYRYVRECGLVGYAQALHADVVDRAWEWRLGVNTRRRQEEPEDGVVTPDAVSYVPTPYGALMEGLKAAGLSRETCLLDYGCGAGRVVLAAASAGAKSAIGVELQPELADLALMNVRSARSVDSSRVSIVMADATKYEVPRFVNMIFLFNPFTGTTLSKVMQRIQESVESHPRDLAIVFFNDTEFRELAKSEEWLRLTNFGIALSRTRWPLPWGIYRSRSGAPG